MPGAQTICWAARFLTLIAVGMILTGCGTFSNSQISWGSRIGLRPDDPVFNAAPADSCRELEKYVAYAVDLKEAYRTRATQNRTWIYVAGIVGLGVAAASGGLAAASAVAAGTLALLAISGGFTAGVFATINNTELADVYTVAANDINTAVGNAKERIDRCGRSTEECGAELAYLTNRVTSARNTLETARTASAAGALARAAAQKKLLDEEITKVLEQVEKEKKAKEAADKQAAAAAAQADADAKQKDANAVKTMADTISKSDASDSDKKNAQGAAAAAQRNADDAQKKADDAAKTAKDAADKAKTDADALAAAMAPVSPPCLP